MHKLPLILLVLASSLVPACGQQKDLDENGKQVSLTQNRKVTLAVSDSYPRLGKKFYRGGVALQCCALLCMLIVVVARVYVALRDSPQSDDPVFSKVTKAIMSSPDAWALIFTALAYICLESLYKGMFIGDDLYAYHVSVTGNGDGADYSVIASSLQAALLDSCHKFSPHKPQCSGAVLSSGDLGRIKECENDPLPTMNVYFEGKSRTVLNYAFFSGCCIIFVSEFAALLQICGKGRWLAKLTKVLLPGDEAVGLDDSLTTKQLFRSFQHGLTVDLQDPKEVASAAEVDKVLRVQAFAKIVLQGLSYGLMMMVLEIQIDDDCVDLRSFFRADVSILFSYVVMIVTVGVIGVIFIFIVIEACRKCCDCEPLGEESRRLLSWVFITVGGLLLIVSVVSYMYSTLLAIYLAYTVPGDSAVMLGCLLALLSLIAQGMDLWKPERLPDLWKSGEDDDDDDDELASQFSEDE